MLTRLRALLQQLRAEVAASGQQPEPSRSRRQVIAVHDDEPTFVPVGTFQGTEAAEAFRERLASRGIASVSWPPDAEGVVVLVPVEVDDLATEFLVESYGVPAGFPEGEACPACELRVAEPVEEPDFEWRCLGCGQVWGAHGPRRP
jgi:hypothetical protein